MVHTHHAVLADGTVVRARRLHLLAFVAVAELSQLVQVKSSAPGASLDCPKSVISWKFLLVSFQFFHIYTSYIRSLLRRLRLAWRLLHVWVFRFSRSCPKGLFIHLVLLISPWDLEKILILWTHTFRFWK